ncbi:hypothetical protein [Legionella fairfieldensis]|uniref:hypothetical protein n=1 Tax=Legionella fairfieldensis TaxID=45064 RepID=UPI0006856489|nr:hypothetical protein [Legionella fairfieldensis]
MQYFELTRKILFFFTAVTLTLHLSGCAVYKAAQNDGVSVSDIKNCNSKECFLSKGMKVIEHREEKNGHVVEVYRAIARKSGLNYLRAAGHGALDVATLGIWEVAGTPIEGAISNNRGYIIAKVTYANSRLDRVIDLSLYNARGKKSN